MCASGCPTRADMNCVNTSIWHLLFLESRSTRRYEGASIFHRTEVTLQTVQTLAFIRYTWVDIGLFLLVGIYNLHCCGEKIIRRVILCEADDVFVFEICAVLVYLLQL